MNVAISRSHRSGSCKQDDDPKLLILRHGRLALLTKRISPNYWDVIAFTMIVAVFVVIPNGSRGNGRGAEAAAYLCKKLHGDAGRGSGGTLTRIASPRYSRGQAAGEADALSVLPYAGGTASPTSSLAPSVASVGYEGRGAVTERVVINIRVTAWSG